MGAVVLTLGILLAAVGFVLFSLIVLDAGAGFEESLIVDWRGLFEQMLPGPDNPLGIRAMQVLAFVVLVGPGLTVFRIGLRMDKRDAEKKD
jgi:hypothetical protein